MQNSGGKPTFSGFNFGASTPNPSTGVTSSVNSTPGTGLNIGSGLATSSAFGGFSFGSSMPKTLGGFSFGTPGTTTSRMAAPAFGSQSTPATGGVFTAPKTTTTGLQFGTPGSASAATTGLFSGTLTTTPATGLFSGSQTNTQSIGLGFSGSQMSIPSTQATGLFSAKLPSTSSTQATGLQFGSGRSTTLFSGFAAPPQTMSSFSFGTSTTQNTQAAAVTKAVTGPMFGSAASGTGTASKFNFSSGAATSGGLSFGTQETAATASTTAKPAGNLAFGSSTTTTQGTLTGGTPGFGMVQTATASTTTVGGVTFGTVKSATGQTTTASTGFKFGGPSATIQGTSTTGLTLGTTQPQGLIASTKAASQTGALPAFGLGQSTTGFNLSGLLSGQAKTSAISTGTTSSSSSGQTTSATTTSGFSLSGTTLGNTSKTTSLLPTTTTTTTTSTTSTINPGFSLTTSQPTTTSSTGFQLGGGPFGNLGTTATTSGFKLPSSVSNSGTTSTANAATSSTTGSTATTTTTTSAEKYTYKQLEEQVNKWNIELEEMEKSFLEQAAQVNVADRELMENGEKITALHSEVERAKAEQNRLDQELDFLLSQQNELEDLLKPLEEYVKQQSAEHGQEPDREREKIYKMAEKCDGQLKGMVQDLREIIDYLNATNASHQQEQNPIMQIAKILNVHMDSLQWIDQNSALLQKRVDEIARLSEMRKKEHERSFGLGFD